MLTSARIAAELREGRECAAFDFPQVPGGSAAWRFKMNNYDCKTKKDFPALALCSINLDCRRRRIRVHKARMPAPASRIMFEMSVYRINAAFGQRGKRGNQHIVPRRIAAAVAQPPGELFWQHPRRSLSSENTGYTQNAPPVVRGPALARRRALRVLPGRTTAASYCSKRLSSASLTLQAAVASQRLDPDR